MNQDRTELIFFAPKRRAKELTDINISLAVQALNLGVHPLRVLMNPTAEPMAICCDLSLGYDFIHDNADLDIPKV
jgi:hypothetical protein